MWTKLTSLFASEAGPAPDPEAQTRRAAAALLVQAARSDDEYDDGEREMIATALARLFALSPEAATALRDEGETAAAEALDNFQFTRAIKEGVPHEERAAFLTEVWRVVLADGRRDAHENAFMRKLSGLLYVSDVESGMARRRAETE